MHSCLGQLPATPSLVAGAAASAAALAQPGAVQDQQEFAAEAQAFPQLGNPPLTAIPC